MKLTYATEIIENTYLKYHVRVFDPNGRQIHHYRLRYKADIASLMPTLEKQYRKPELKVVK